MENQMQQSRIYWFRCMRGGAWWRTQSSLGREKYFWYDSLYEYGRA